MPLLHPFEPIFDPDSRILLLGSFPSVKSRENAFYYGHPQNRFWRLIAALCGEALPQTNAQKKAMLLSHRIALWDVLKSCEITGSSDASIRHPIANNIDALVRQSAVSVIGCNGSAAWQIYQKYVQPKPALPVIMLPSTSPANASYRFERLLACWKEALGPYLNECSPEASPSF